MTTEHPWIKAAKYLGLRKTRASLDRSVREYKLDLLHRRVVHDAVCDAVEGFCDEPVIVLTGPLSWPFDYIDGVRIVAQFDILKDEGV